MLDPVSPHRPALRAKKPAPTVTSPSSHGIGYHAPADVHYGRAEAIRAERAQILDAAYAAKPERLVRKPPVPPALPTVAWINEPTKEDDTSTQ